MAAHHWVYDYACVSRWAWWKVMAAHHWVYDYACVSRWAWWEVMAAHHWVYDCMCVTMGLVESNDSPPLGL